MWPPDNLKWAAAPPAFPKGAQIAVLSGDPSKDAVALVLVVGAVVPVVHFLEARAAPGLKFVWLRSSDGWELIERFRLAAARAGLHLHT